MDVLLTEDRVRPAYERIMAAGGLIAAAGVSAVIWYFDPQKVNFLPVCPLFKMTGIACPGCGMTRGFHALFHGDIVTAIDFNALSPLFALIFGLLFLSLLFKAVRGRGFFRLVDAPKIMIPLLGLMIVFAVLRNLPFYPFTFLYP